MRTRGVMNLRLAAAALAAIGAFGIGTAAAPRDKPIEHFTAKSALMTSSARLTLRPVDIAISRWSTYDDHLTLSETLLEKGPAAFMNLLCSLGSVGTITVMDAPQVAIRYAWFIEERSGRRRIYLGTDQPVPFAGPFFRRLPDAESLTFIELRINPNGVGEGKLSDAASLSVDESRNVIELRDYDRRPLHLLMVRSDHVFEE
jgi:hypothetical protein